MSLLVIITMALMIAFLGGLLARRLRLPNIVSIERDWVFTIRICA
jgi:hypothetical protein